MKIIQQLKHSPELPIGFFTWLLVAGFSLAQWQQQTDFITPIFSYSTTNLIIACALFLAYAIAFIIIHLKKHLVFGFSLAATSLLCLMFQFNNGIILILAIMFITDLSEHIPLKQAVLLGFAIPMTYFPIVLQEGAWENAFLFSAFNLFAIFVNNRFKSEQRAKEKASRLVRELKATQKLLTTTSKRDERLKIARDLHDAIGHHLTALSLQLEVARQLSDANGQVNIERAQNITRLLLSDVREAVSELRREKPIDVVGAIKHLIDDIDAIVIKLSISDDFTINDARVAEAGFRTVQEAITNVLKHSNANKCEVKLSRIKDEVLISVRDNGMQNTNIVPGNGLTGMTERINKLDGILTLKNDDSGYHVRVILPDPQEYL